MPKQIKLDEAALKNALQSMLNDIHDTNDPEELNAYRAIFRKYVPLFSRAYVAAYLLRNLKGVSIPSTRPSRLSARDNAPSRENSSAASQQRDGFTTLFVGVGRSRRVYPRDIMGLLSEQAKLSKDDIGTIKILDNYSFVDVVNDKTQATIEKLNNFEFRGRALAVNFAKKKD